jgi:hypothetical protein
MPRQSKSRVKNLTIFAKNVSRQQCAHGDGNGNGFIVCFFDLILPRFFITSDVGELDGFHGSVFASVSFSFRCFLHFRQ